MCQSCTSQKPSPRSTIGPGDRGDGEKQVSRVVSVRVVHRCRCGFRGGAEAKTQAENNVDPVVLIMNGTNTETQTFTTRLHRARV